MQLNEIKKNPKKIYDAICTYCKTKHLYVFTAKIMFPAQHYMFFFSCGTNELKDHLSINGHSIFLIPKPLNDEIVRRNVFNQIYSMKYMTIENLSELLNMSLDRMYFIISTYFVNSLINSPLFILDYEDKMSKIVIPKISSIDELLIYTDLYTLE